MIRHRSAFTLIELMIAIAIIAILAAILAPNFKKARARGQLSSCLQQCKNTATALEMYAVDNEGRYPSGSGLAGLTTLITQSYLKKIPTCPSAGQCTFLDYAATTTPDSFSFSCVGDNHRDSFTGIPLPSNNIPRYSSELGPLDHPQ